MDAAHRFQTFWNVNTIFLWPKIENSRISGMHEKSPGDAKHPFQDFWNLWIISV
jgi:hypothetical protein